MKKSRTIIKIKGLNQERAINSISKKMKIYNIKRKSNNICTLEVDFEKKKEILSLLKEQNLEVVEVYSQGLKWKLKSFFGSYGLIAGIIICTFFYCFQYNFIWHIKVVGNEILKDKEISTFVENNLKSKQKNHINSKEIEQNLIEKFDKISSASVAIIGQTLIININETIIPDEMQSDNQEIVSKFDGIVTDINLVQGTLAVDVGDIVRKGDVLVYPYIIDSQGQKREVFPKAEIWADVWISASETHYEYKITTQRTGKKESISEVYLYDILIYSTVKEIDYSQFEIEKSSCYLNKNNILPFVLNKVTYYETKTKEELIEFNQVKEDIIEKARQKTLIFLQENEIIKNEKITIKEAGSWHEVTCLVTVNRNIGE